MTTRSEALPLRQVYLSLGSNQAAGRHLRAALQALRDSFGYIVVSTAYRSRSVGFAGADFINLAVGLQTALDPVALKRWLSALEDAQGRRRNQPRYADRTLDVDIVFYANWVDPRLKLPRDELRHAFVLRPLAEIAPDFCDPRTGRRLAALWAASAAEAATLQPVALAELD